MDNINNYKTRLFRDFNFCKRVFNGGIETEIQLQIFTNGIRQSQKTERW